jgi:hypothetical protein
MSWISRCGYGHESLPGICILPPGPKQNGQALENSACNVLVVKPTVNHESHFPKIVTAVFTQLLSTQSSRAPETDEPTASHRCCYANRGNQIHLLTTVSKQREYFALHRQNSARSGACNLSLTTMPMLNREAEWFQRSVSLGEQLLGAQFLVPFSDDH